MFIGGVGGNALDLRGVRFDDRFMCEPSHHANAVTSRQIVQRRGITMHDDACALGRPASAQKLKIRRHRRTALRLRHGYGQRIRQTENEQREGKHNSAHHQ
jgi:hypothetical protein